MKIGLTYTGTQEKHSNYQKWLKQNDDSIEIITLSAHKQNGDVIKQCNGLVLSGGVDIHPEFYSSTSTEYPNNPDEFERERDEFEFAVFRQAQSLKMPVLGICRGLQLVNCVLGGTLEQDMGDGNDIHKAHHEEGVQVDKTHGVRVIPGTVLSEIFKTETAVVNSAHHQCIDRVADELKVSCVSDNGVIEGLEWENPAGKSFLLCIHWHPERMYKFNLENTAASIAIRNRFIEEIKKTKS